MERSIARQLGVMATAWAEPREAAARASAEPQQMYLDLAASCPVKQVDEETYVLTTMADVLYVTKHHEVEQGSKYLGSDRPAIPLGLDGADHRKYRHLLDPVFTAKRVEPLAEQVRKVADELIDGFLADGHVDAYLRWCEPLPSTVFLAIMGLPMEDLRDFLHFKDLTLGNAELGDIDADARLAKRTEAVTWIHTYFNDDLDRRDKESEPRDDMIGWLLTAEVDGERLSRQDMLDILGLLMIAGLDTVAASLACFLSYFARHPEERRSLVRRPELIRSAIEELMRFESPVVDGFRIANADLTLPSGAEIPRGSWMLVSWSAANLDPAVFPNPLEVDFERRPNPHIGFASGFHRCLGSHLARMEMRVALEAWHARIPDYALPAGAALTYSGNPRAPHSLPLTWS
jgi:cytochrome P450